MNYPLKPGETRFDVGYSLPAADTFSGKSLNAGAPTRLVTPPAVTLSGDGVESLRAGAADPSPYLRRFGTQL